MSVPEYHVFMKPVLELLSDGKAWTNQAVYAGAAKSMQLTEEEQAERVESGRQLKLHVRSAWALTYLRQAQLIESVGRGQNRITDRGRNYLQRAPQSITPRDLTEFAEFVDFQKRSKTVMASEKPLELDLAVDSTPEERIASAHHEHNAALAEELLDRLRSMPPSAFENLIVQLMLRLGYGGSEQDAGRTLGRSGDGGVDGVIREDKLGLDNIYLQAKRWTGNSVGRPDVQAFVGALHGHGANKGVFITTSTFSREAIEYARQLGTIKLSLVDGSELARLMIEHNLGVAVVYRYDVKRVDSDFFGGDDR